MEESITDHCQFIGGIRSTANIASIFRLFDLFLII
jgi:hypothetical protein